MLCIANNYRVGGREDDGGLVDRCWDDRPITAVASEAQSCLGVLSKHKLSCKNHKTWQQQHLCPTTEQHCVMWFWLWATGLEFLSWCQRGWSVILFYFVKVFPSCGTFWLIDSHPVFFHLPFHTRLQWTHACPVPHVVLHQPLHFPLSLPQRLLVTFASVCIQVLCIVKFVFCSLGVCACVCVHPLLRQVCFCFQN